MRRYATFFFIAVMTAGLFVMLVSRSRPAHDAPAEILEAKADAGADATAVAVAVGDASAADAAPVDAGAPKPAERPMRVATLGWELASAAAMMAPGALEVAPEPALEALEARLARGGADPLGADVAVLPLPAFVMAYERLRALEPRAFLVVGFSHGREEVHAAPGALAKPPAGDAEVKLVAIAHGGSDTPTGWESATSLGLFALDLLGVAPSRVRIVAPGSEPAKGALVSAVARGTADERKLAFSTADASRLVPLVAIAPKAQLESGEAKVGAFAKEWLDALARAAKDAPGVARRLSAKEGLSLAAGVGGAPEPIALVERLGQIELVTAAEQPALFGRGAMAPSTSPATLDVLTQRMWQLARGGGLVATPAPDPLPIDARIATTLAPAPAPRAPAPAEGDAGLGTIPQGATPLVVYRAPLDATVDAVAAQIGFLAAVFPRAAFRVTAKGGEKAARALATQAQSRFELPPARLAVTAGEPAGAFATVEIASLP